MSASVFIPPAHWPRATWFTPQQLDEMRLAQDISQMTAGSRPAYKFHPDGQSDARRTRVHKTNYS